MPDVRPWLRPLRAASGPALVLGVLAGAALAAGDDLPALRQGLWESERTVQDPTKPGPPKKESSRRCTSPTENLKRRRERLAQSCKLSLISKTGSSYSYSASCQFPDGRKGTAKTVITTSGNTAYTIKTESEGIIPGKTGKIVEEMSAKRVGDCAG